MEAPFDETDGVISTTSGYTGGDELQPSYAEVAAGQTGHVEAIRVVYDPTIISYSELVNLFWHNIDPLQDDGQFCDRGSQYRSAIFTSDENEIQVAKESKLAIATQLNATVVTEIRPAAAFWVAEAYHQNYYRVQPQRYAQYRIGCGRDNRLMVLWGQTGH